MSVKRSKNAERDSAAVLASWDTVHERASWPCICRIAGRVLASFGQPVVATTESDVAEAVWRAANDTTGQLRFPAGADAVALARSAQSRQTPRAFIGL